MREKVVEWQNMEDSERARAVLSYACRSSGIGGSVERIGTQKQVVIDACLNHKSYYYYLSKTFHFSHTHSMQFSNN